MVVNGGAPEVDVGIPQAISGLIPHRILTGPNSGIDRHPASIPGAAVRTTIPVLSESPIWRRAWAGLGHKACALPHNVEGVTLRAIVGVVNPHHGRPPSARLAD